MLPRERIPFNLRVVQSRTRFLLETQVMAQRGMVIVGLAMGLAMVDIAAADGPTASRPAQTGWAKPSAALADRLGCTHVSGSYNFTKKDFMSEGADEILKLGMRTLKLYLNKPQIHYKFNCQWPEFRDLVEHGRSPLLPGGV